MMVVGLTGGIASGKTLVATLFAKKNIDIIDTDQIARELVIPGSEGLAAIVEHFGQTILTEHGHLNRRALRMHIFNHLLDKKWLEAYLHPRIRTITNERIGKAR